MHGGAGGGVDAAGWPTNVSLEFLGKQRVGARDRADSMRPSEDGRRGRADRPRRDGGAGATASVPSFRPPGLFTPSTRDRSALSGLGELRRHLADEIPAAPPRPRLHAPPLTALAAALAGAGLVALAWVFLGGVH